MMGFGLYGFGSLLLVLGVAASEDLYFVSHGNANNLRPGLYGGQMGRNGTSEDLFSSGYHCAWFEEGSVSFNPLAISAVSYDPKSKEALLNIIEPIDNKISLIKAPLCLDIPSCSNISRHLQPLFMHTRISGGKMGPFAYYDKVIYFVFLRQEMADGGTKVTFEIRKIAGCDNFPYSSIEPFVLEDCTEAVAVLHEVVIDESTEELARTNSLLAVKTSSGVRFFTQIQHLTISENIAQTNHMQLYTVKEGGEATLINTDDVPISYVGLDYQGDLDYRDGLLCWTSTTKLLCGTWKNDRLQDVQVVLGEEQASEVCRDITNEGQTGNVKTGVTIASVRPISVYFGCTRDNDRGSSSNWQPGGGAGYAKMTEGGVEVHPLKSNGTQVYASGMFLTNACADRHQGTSGAPRLSYQAVLVSMTGLLYGVYEILNKAIMYHM